MKRTIGLLLTIALLLALTAPAMAKDVIAAGEYDIDIHLNVPNGAPHLNSFRVTIPDDIGVQYGAIDTVSFYAMELYPDKIPQGMAVKLEVTTEDYEEWEIEDEEGHGTGEYDYGGKLRCNENDDCFDYDVYTEHGNRRLQPAPYGWEFRNEPKQDDYNYERFVDRIFNFYDETCDYTDGNITVKVHFDRNENAQPGNYYSALTFHVDADWAFSKQDLAERGFKYIIADGYRDELAEDFDSESTDCAFNPDGWPWYERVDGVEPLNP